MRQMSGEEIAKESGWSRQYTSKLLKSGLGKLYYKLKKLNPDMTPFEITNGIREYFDLRSSEDIKNFFTLFPPKVKKEIEESLKVWK